MKTSVHEPKDVATSDAKRKDDPGYDSSVQSSIQKPKDVTTDIKMAAYDSSVQLLAQESDTATDIKTEDKPAHNSTMQSSVQESKDATTDVKSPTYDGSIHTSVQESKDTDTVDVKMEDDPSNDTSIP